MGHIHQGDVYIYIHCDSSLTSRRFYFFHFWSWSQPCTCQTGALPAEPHVCFRDFLLLHAVHPARVSSTLLSVKSPKCGKGSIQSVSMTTGGGGGSHLVNVILAVKGPVRSGPCVFDSAFSNVSVIVIISRVMY